MLTAFRSETRHPQTGVRVVDRIDPETDPYSPGKPEPDPAVVPKINRRHVVLAGAEVLFASKDLNAALGDARRRNRELATDVYAVEIIDIDDTDDDGKLCWAAIRSWLAAAGDDLQPPPLARPRPEDSDEAKGALRTVRQLSQDLTHAARNDFFHFAERASSVIAADSTMTHTLSIVSASRVRLDAVLAAHRLNQQAGPGERYHVRAVNIAIDAGIDAKGDVEAGPYRRFVQKLKQAELQP